jgi:hypothetical protein
MKSNDACEPEKLPLKLIKGKVLSEGIGIKKSIFKNYHSLKYPGQSRHSDSLKFCSTI